MGAVKYIMGLGMESPFHACGTCVNFAAEKTQAGMVYRCVRLGFKTKPSYQFNCWEPKEHVKKLIEKRKGEKQ